MHVYVFFFSSRRRHTRCGRDWSSDVCSSDLAYDPVLINAYMLEDLNQFYQRLLEYIPEQYKHYMVNPADVGVTWDMLESFAMELFAPYLDMYASAGIYASATPRGIAAYDVADDEWGALFFKSNGGTDAQAGAAHQGDA